jgi:hypothetical protein
MVRNQLILGSFGGLVVSVSSDCSSSEIDGVPYLVSSDEPWKLSLDTSVLGVVSRVSGTMPMRSLRLSPYAALLLRSCRLGVEKLRLPWSTIGGVREVEEVAEYGLF